MTASCWGNRKRRGGGGQHSGSWKRTRKRGFQVVCSPWLKHWLVAACLPACRMWGLRLPLKINHTRLRQHLKSSTKTWTTCNSIDVLVEAKNMSSQVAMAEHFTSAMRYHCNGFLCSPLGPAAARDPCSGAVCFGASHTLSTSSPPLQHCAVLRIGCWKNWGLRM